MRVTRLAGRAVVVVLSFAFAVQGVKAAPDPEPKGAAARIAALEAAVSALQAQVAALQAAPVLALGPYVSVSPDPVNGLAGPHVFFTGVNVHVRSGSGSTSDYTDFPPGTAVLTGLGNLVIGYNDRLDDPSPVADRRRGSHNLVVGDNHHYSSFGGFLAGYGNTVTGRSSTASGSYNMVSGRFSTVTGGNVNRAVGDLTNVLGGQGNTAIDGTVCGGRYNTASGFGSTVSGGERNTASGTLSTVSGGKERVAAGEHDWAAGEFFSEE